MKAKDEILAFRFGGAVVVPGRWNGSRRGVESPGLAAWAEGAGNGLVLAKERKSSEERIGQGGLCVKKGIATELRRGEVAEAWVYGILFACFFAIGLIGWMML